MKIAFKLAKLIIWIAVSLSLVVVALLLTLAQDPAILINDHNLGIASHLAGRSGYPVLWRQGHVSVESIHFLEKRIHLKFNDICANIQAQGVHACFGSADLSVAVGLGGLKFRVTEIGPIHLEGGDIAYDSNQSESKNNQVQSTFPSFLVGAHIYPVHVDVPKLNIIAGGQRLEGQGRIQIQNDQEASVQLALSDKDRVDQTQLQLNVKLTRRETQLSSLLFKIQASYQQSQKKIATTISGDADTSTLNADIQARATGWIPRLREVSVDHCIVGFKHLSATPWPSALHVACPIKTEITHIRTRGFPLSSLPSPIGARLFADIKSKSFPPSADSPIEGNLSLRLDPLSTPLFEAGSQIETRIAGVPSDFPKGWTAASNLGLRIDITHFQQLVKQLSASPAAVWAPLNVLHGQVSLDAQGTFDLNRGTLPILLKTRLRSKRQNLDLDADGTVTVSRTASPQNTFLTHLGLNIALSNVQIELPPLPQFPTPTHPKPDSLPQFAPDGRILTTLSSQNAGQAAGTSEPPFSYDVKIHTPDAAHPIRLITPQIKTPIPIAADLELTNKTGIHGQIQVLKFPMELFRRQVTLDHLTLNLAQPSKNSTLNGLVQIPYTDYTITVLLLGTLDKPQIKFMSDPPLPDDQIAAVLIFGQSLDALSPDEQQSVGNSRAALREGAFSLFSLYYLSSMNIESIDYDPDTHTASMRYRLAEGTSLNLSQGTGGGQPSVGLRKRLSKHLAITTSLNNPSEQQTQRTVSTFLEWAFQY